MCGLILQLLEGLLLYKKKKIDPFDPYRRLGYITCDILMLEHKVFSGLKFSTLLAFAIIFYFKTRVALP